jgi:hypothetical protein
MSAPNGLPGIMVSIVVGVAFIPGICNLMEEENYFGVALLGLGALAIGVFLIWAWVKVSDHFWEKKKEDK